MYVNCSDRNFNLKDGDYSCLDDIILKSKELPNPEGEVIKEVIILIIIIFNISIALFTIKDQKRFTKKNIFKIR